MTKTTNSDETTVELVPTTSAALAAAGKAMVAAIWMSTILFGAYILAFYVANWLDGDITQWNEFLPDLYNSKQPAATVGMGIHFIGGGIILILGCIQIINSIRVRFPKFHRVTGRIYALACLITAIGGLTFIFISGTAGGLVMDIGFAGYGLCMLIAVVETIRHAMAKRFSQHRAWALRLFALAIGSWLYRMYYGFWFLFMGRLGHTSDFRGWFDYFMDFWFYIPNLIVVEIILGRIAIFRSSSAQKVATVILFTSVAFVLLGTYFFTVEIWGPKILRWLVPQ
ncbi:DUF2306 domain-containing protein [Rubellicoccus peritrichatus]|uniref:DUF2306 domain-containing protein n=1 Tax=Rubellicoccus peritrichatus TaxID=3080537 RepID=A0AAQ3LFP5_9BACT|nr:DUF2306 domain-containing protein [Puniceicoccus sp. CR14]WOO43719.1 DUF2306 domain-containing protein [Puniceicoccus sp. CR14]